MYLQKVIGRTKNNYKKNLFFVGTLRVTRVGSGAGSAIKCTDPRLRIRAKMPRIRNTASTVILFFDCFHSYEHCTVVTVLSVTVILNCQYGTARKNYLCFTQRLKLD